MSRYKFIFILDFACDKCGKCFATLDLLKRHYLHHTEPRFPCQMCNKKYHLSSLLGKHIKQVHDQIIVDCDVCGKKVNAQQLSRHKRAFHSDKEKQNCPIPGKKTLIF